jgi:hypothetical protein
MDTIVEFLRHFAEAFDAVSGLLERIAFRALGLFAFIALVCRFTAALRRERHR